MIREIPDGAELLTTGLYVHRFYLTVGGTDVLLGRLYSTEGYCFYDNEVEVFDEEGNLIAQENILPSQRLYMQFRTLSRIEAPLTNAELTARFISVAVDTSYENVSVGRPTVTI